MAYEVSTATDGLEYHLTDLPPVVSDPSSGVSGTLSSPDRWDGPTRSCQFRLACASTVSAVAADFRRPLRERVLPRRAAVLVASLLLSLTSVQAADTCQPDADLSALVYQLQDMSGRLAGDADADPCPRVLSDPNQPLDDLWAVCAAVEALEARAVERKGLCRQVAGLTAQVAGFTESLAIQEGLGERCRADRAAAWDELEARIKAPPMVRTRPVSCIVGGALGADLLGETGGFGGPAIACGWTLF